MLMKTGIFYFTTCFHGFGILRHVDPFVRMLHNYDCIDTLVPKQYFAVMKTNTVKCKLCIFVLSIASGSEIYSNKYANVITYTITFVTIGE